MANAIIMHGKPNPGNEEYYNPHFPAASNSHWLPWLQKQLIIRDISTQTPEIPHSWKPKYSTWRHEFERYDITAETVLIGHSCGGGFLVRWLSENKSINVGRVILVAPWLDPEHQETGDFFDFEMDRQLIQRTKGLIVFNSDDDSPSIQKSVRLIRENIASVHYREFHKYGHFIMGDMKTEQFPELLNEAIM